MSTNLGVDELEANLKRSHDNDEEDESPSVPVKIKHTLENELDDDEQKNANTEKTVLEKHEEGMKVRADGASGSKDGVTSLQIPSDLAQILKRIQENKKNNELEKKEKEKKAKDVKEPIFEHPKVEGEVEKSTHMDDSDDFDEVVVLLERTKEEIEEEERYNALNGLPKESVQKKVKKPYGEEDRKRLKDTIAGIFGRKTEVGMNKSGEEDKRDLGQEVAKDTDKKEDAEGQI